LIKQTRITKQRQVVLEELQKVTTHPTADMVYDMVRKRLPNISLGTVYRNLELLAEQGIIRKLNIDEHKMRFDGNTSNHFHIQCIECGKVDDVSICENIDWLELTQDTGYEITGHRIELFGICPDCRSKQLQDQ